jgi:hypothetical protein
MASIAPIDSNGQTEVLRRSRRASLASLATVATVATVATKKDTPMTQRDGSIRWKGQQPLPRTAQCPTCGAWQHTHVWMCGGAWYMACSRCGQVRWKAIWRPTSGGFRGP